MAEINAKLRYLRMAPRKVRLMADLIRGKSVDEAQAILNFSTKRSALPLLKLLNSAAAGAKKNLEIEQSNLWIAKITVDEGPKLKRWRARSRGQAFEIQKKTSHINLILSEIEKKAKKGKKKTKKDKTEKPQEKKEVKPKETKEKPKFRARKEIQKPGIKNIGQKMFKRKDF